LRVAERFAEGKASDEARRRAAASVMHAANDFGPGWHPFGIVPAAEAIHWCLGKTFSEMKAAFNFAAAARASAHQDKPYRNAQIPRKVHLMRARELKAQADIVRDILGNPFRPVTINPAWQTSNAVALAQSIYDDRAFDRLPILADALEDAGCDNADILNHCRQPGDHVRGCWVVDLVLGMA
jgi:hypothetical protein